MDAAVAIILKTALVGAGIVYIARLVWNSLHAKEQTLEAKPVGATSGGRVQWWETLRGRSLTAAITCLVALALVGLLNGPVVVVEGLLVAVGVCVIVYLVASAAAGWLEGTSRRGP